MRIIASDDGGKTWQLVDGALQASGQNACDFTPILQGAKYLNSCLIIVGATGKATFWAVAEETGGNTLFRYDQP